MKSIFSKFITQRLALILIFAPLFLCLSNARAQQWIIDGQRIQSLEIHVSDPQAFYTDGSREMTAPIKFTQSHTATNGALQIYATDSEEHLGYFKTLSFQDGLQFSAVRSAMLFFGQNPSDGLLIGPSQIMQTGYGFSLDFEAGSLGGSWQISGNPSTALGIVNKGYADGRYLLRTSGITTNRVIQAGNTLVISNGLITAIIP